MSRRAGIAVAVAIAAVVGLVAALVLIADDDDGDDVAVDETSSTSESTTTTSEATTTSAEDGDARSSIAAVDQAGRLLALDPDSGEVRHVLLEGIRTDDPAKNDVAVSPDGQTAYVVLPGPSGEPAQIVRVPMGGDSGAEPVARGQGISISPDGASLAYVDFEDGRQPEPVLVVRDLGSGEERRLQRENEPGFVYIAETAWTLDNGSIAFIAGEIRTGLYLIDPGASDLDAARRLGPVAREEDASWRAVTAFDSSRLAVVETCCDGPQRERWLVLAVHLPEGQVEGGLLPDERVEATQLDADADGGDLVYVTGGGPDGGTLWSWDGSGEPNQLADGIIVAAW